MVKIGLQIPWFSWPGAPANQRQVLADAARAVDDAGFSSLWVMDHFFQLEMIGPPTMDMHEGYTTLGYLAGVTERITLGTLVTGVTYRHPGILAKQVTTLDVLSGGRAWLGIGAAWFEREHLGLGVTFPSTSERFERLEEALQIVKQMWSDDEGPYHGTHYRLAETICSPRPLQRPHPPIMVGGGGERKTLRLVAQYADACNIAGDVATVEHKLGVLRRHCDEVGRDYAAVSKTTMIITPPSGEAAAGLAEPLIAAGVDHVIFTALPVHQTDVLSTFATDVVKRLGDL